MKISAISMTCTDTALPRKAASNAAASARSVTQIPASTTTRTGIPVCPSGRTGSRSMLNVAGHLGRSGHNRSSAFLPLFSLSLFILSYIRTTQTHGMHTIKSNQPIRTYTTFYFLFTPSSPYSNIFYATRRVASRSKEKIFTRRACTRTYTEQ